MILETFLGRHSYRRTVLSHLIIHITPLTHTNKGMLTAPALYNLATLAVKFIQTFQTVITTPHFFRFNIARTMKPSKKQNNHNLKKTKGNLNESSVPLIQSFFQAAPKSFVVDKTNDLVNRKNGDRQFYVDFLKSKLESYPDDESLANGKEKVDEADGVEQTGLNRNVETKTTVDSEVNTSKNKCSGCVQKAVERDEWERKYNVEFEQRKQLKKVYMNLNIEFSELYMKYQSLLKVVKGADSQIVQGEASGSGTSAKDNEAAAKHDDDFTDAQIKFLQFMPLDKKFDCTFILQCLKYAYKSDPTVLASRTLKGTAERTEINSEGIEIHHEGKAPLSPKKVDRIKGLFMDRIAKCGIHSAEFVERVNDPYVNKLIAAGIGNMSKKKK